MLGGPRKGRVRRRRRCRLGCLCLTSCRRSRRLQSFRLRGTLSSAACRTRPRRCCRLPLRCACSRLIHRWRLSRPGYLALTGDGGIRACCRRVLRLGRLQAGTGAHVGSARCRPLRPCVVVLGAERRRGSRGRRSARHRAEGALAHARGLARGPTRVSGLAAHTGSRFGTSCSAFCRNTWTAAGSAQHSSTHQARPHMRRGSAYRWHAGAALHRLCLQAAHSCRRDHISKTAHSGPRLLERTYRVTGQAWVVYKEQASGSCTATCSTPAASHQTRSCRACPPGAASTRSRSGAAACQWARRWPLRSASLRPRHACRQGAGLFMLTSSKCSRPQAGSLHDIAAGAGLLRTRQPCMQARLTQLPAGSYTIHQQRQETV